MGGPQRASLHLAPTPGEKGGRQDVLVDPDPPNKASEHGQDGREYGTKVREETKNTIFATDARPAQPLGGERKQLKLGDRLVLKVRSTGDMCGMQARRLCRLAS